MYNLLTNAIKQWLNNVLLGVRRYASTTDININDIESNINNFINES